MCFITVNNSCYWVFDVLVFCVGLSVYRAAFGASVSVRLHRNSAAVVAMAQVLCWVLGVVCVVFCVVCCVLGVVCWFGYLFLVCWVLSAAC